MKQLPHDLALRLSTIIPEEEINLFNQALGQEKRQVSCRLNTLKTSSEEIEKAFRKASIGFRKLDFPSDCYVLDEGVVESDLWRLKIYKSGKIYVQGISSQIPVQFFNSVLNTGDSYQDEREYSDFKILDACAAPGGKTSQLAALYPDAEIWAFEPSKIRYEKMKYNLEKLGIETSSQVQCIHDEVGNIGKYISDFEYFDMILVDAPCSGEGSLSLHNTRFLENWNKGFITKNYARQKSICDSVLPYLRDGGEMIYSTCTIAPEENEGVIHYLLCKYPELTLKKIDIESSTYIKSFPALKNFEKYFFKKEIAENCVRVIPSEFSEGFFVAKLIKKSS